VSVGGGKFQKKRSEGREGHAEVGHTCRPATLHTTARVLCSPDRKRRWLLVKLRGASYCEMRPIQRRTAARAHTLTLSFFPFPRTSAAEAREDR
jgi:hypothetical protein